MILPPKVVFYSGAWLTGAANTSADALTGKLAPAWTCPASRLSNFNGFVILPLLPRPKKRRGEFASLDRWWDCRYLEFAEGAFRLGSRRCASSNAACAP